MMNTRVWSRLVVTTALAGGLLFAASAARADHDWNADCNRRLEADRARIDHDSARFGNDSHKVMHDVDRMDADRQWCRDHHADWDHSHFDVGIYLHK